MTQLRDGIDPPLDSKTDGALNLRGLDAARHPNIRKNEGARTV